MNLRTIQSFLILNLLIAASIYAQPRPGNAPAGARTFNGTITGTVTSEESQDPIPTATVAVWSGSDSTLVTGGVTLGNGAFEITGLRPGSYYVHVSFVGYKSRDIYDITLSRANPRVDVGTIALALDSQMMDEVEVVAERDFVEVGIDRTVYNTRDQLVSAGGTASNVLENIPSVEVDIDGNISFRGNSNVAILINGRPSPMTGEALANYLQGLPADMIDRVEVIPNPSAKYEPDGMAGILNIELKKDKELGISGGVSLSAATQGRYTSSGNLNFQRGKLNVFTSYGFNYSDRISDGWRLWENRASERLTVLDQDSDGTRTGISHNLNTSIDYSLSKQNTLTLSGMLNARNGDNDQLTAYAELFEADELFNRFDRTTFGDNNNLSTEYRLSFRRIIEPRKHELTIEAEYEQEWGDDDGEYVEELFDLGDMATSTIAEQQNDFQEENNREMSFQVDYTRPLGNGAKMELGMRSELELLESDYFSETLNPETNQFLADIQRNNTFNYDLNTHAAYLILGTDLGKFGFQAGVRLEQAFTTFELETTGESFDNDYFSVFPSAFVTYKLTETRSLKAAYSKRINRPRTGGWFNQLNPFDTNEDPYFRFIGNPYLDPEFVHSFEFSFTQFTKATSLTLTPYFTHTVDRIRFYQTVDEAGISTTTFENFDTSNSWGMEAIATYKQGRRFNAFVSLNGFQVITDGSNVDSGLSNTAFGFSSRFNGTLNVSPTLDVQFTYFYRAPMDIEGGRIYARQSASMAVRQKLFNNKANLSLRFSDIFNTMGFQLERESSAFFQEINRTFQAQGIGINFSYNFGKQIRQQRRGTRPARTVGADDNISM